MTSKLALHFQQLPGWAGQTAARWVKVMEPPSDNRWPGKYVIGRAYMPDVDSNRMVAKGAAGAEEWFNFLVPYMARSPYVHAWEGPNEPQPVADLGFARKLGEFTARLADLMHQSGHRIVGGCLSEGNPGGDEAQRKACFQAIAPGLAKCDYWSQHCYWVLGTTHPENGMNEWHAFRYRMNIRYAGEKNITLPPLLITECGVDGGVVGVAKKGWKTFCGTRVAYMDQLRQFDGELGNDPYVLAATVFTSGPNGDWADFEVDQELSRMIDAHISASGGPYNPAQNNLATALRARFGANFEDLTGSLPTSSTEQYTKRPLSDIQYVTVHHSETSRAITWQSVAQYHVNGNKWPGIAYHIGIRLYGGRCVVSLLNQPETRSYHAHAAGNNYGLALCIMGSFDNASPDPVEVSTARAVVEVGRQFLGRPIPVNGHRDVPGNDTACPGNGLYAELDAIGGTTSDLEAALRAEADRRQVIQFNPAAALQSKIFAHGFVPNSPEFTLEKDGKTYVGQRAESLANGVVRVYYCQTGDWGNVKWS